MRRWPTRWSLRRLSLPRGLQHLGLQPGSAVHRWWATPPLVRRSQHLHQLGQSISGHDARAPCPTHPLHRRRSPSLSPWMGRQQSRARRLLRSRRPSRPYAPRVRHTGHRVRWTGLVPVSSLPRRSLCLAQVHALRVPVHAAQTRAPLWGPALPKLQVVHQHLLRAGLPSLHVRCRPLWPLSPPCCSLMHP